MYSMVLGHPIYRWDNLLSRRMVYVCIWRGYRTPRSLTDGRARSDIFAAGHVRIVSFRDLCDHRGPSSGRSHQDAGDALRARSARFALMHKRCHTHCSIFRSAWSALARNFRLTPASMAFRDVVSI